jgi:hypothetical protein
VLPKLLSHHEFMMRAGMYALFEADTEVLKEWRIS